MPTHFEPLPGNTPIGPDPRKPLIIPVSKLIVDDNYQRQITELRLTKLVTLALDWDWSKAEAPTVVPIGNGTFRVVEGQGRVLALQMRDNKAKLICLVLPDEERGVEREAAVALGIAIGRERHDAFERWTLAKRKGDKLVLMGEKVLANNGLRMASYGSANVIGAVAAVEKILRKPKNIDAGGELLDATLRTLCRAWPYDPEDTTARFKSMVLGVVAAVIYRNPNIDLDRLTQVLAMHSVMRWLNDADGTQSKFNALGEHVTVAYNRRKRGRRITWKQDPIDDLADLVEDRSADEEVS